MELRRLRYFIVTADELHVARAAERLGIAQPALSQQIRVLEESLGVRLFDRVSRGIRLSAVGATFLPYAIEAVAAADRAIEVAKGAARGERGKLEIGYVGSAMMEPALPHLIGAFRQRFPDVEIQMRNLPVGSQFEHLLDQRLDIAFVRYLSQAVPSSLRAEVFYSTRLVAAVPSGHPVATAAAPKLADLSQDSFVVLQDNQTQGFFIETVIEVCEKAGFVPRIDLKVGDIASMVGLVSAGLGVCLVPALISSLAMPNVTFRPLEDLDAPMDLLMVTRKNDSSPAVRRFLSLVG
ncbi:LysR substrate-binding domain-containing protein [Asticcacaulis sp. W401b]|uniref:LysR substrate-binding domain-containing protein n=1 Tax=Asticcacaulis sp. W401b TaxID=3388666 RepID=UPI003970D795